VSASPHKLILASAGTGKTYQLSGRFLALLFRGVPPERILATTFTRKAAGEILDRVLKRLVDAAEDPAQLEALNAQLAGDGAPAATREGCVRLLAALGRGLHRFRIRTLDAFFVQLAGVFALDLGLPPEWRILEEDELKVLQRDALGDALRRAERPEVLELLRAMQKIGTKGASRSVERSLLKTVEDCRDAYLDSQGPAWDRVNVPEGLDEGRFAEVLDELAAMALPNDKRWRTARDKLFAQAQSGEWEDAFKSGLLAKFAEGGTGYHSKDFTQAHLAVFEALQEQAAHDLLASVKRQNFASYEWLWRFERAFYGAKDAAGGLSFEDVPRALAPPPPATAGPAAKGLNVLRGDEFDFHYRLDGKVDHLLLDEFQDTAPMQWRVLAPLAEEILADGTAERSFFCVGDVKQSIYAWRSGEPRLLEGMNARYPALPPALQLVENWRSSPVVLDAVDRVFTAIGESPAFEKRQAQRDAARKFQAVYSAHVAARPLPGAVTLYQSPSPSGGGGGGAAEVSALELAADRARRISVEAPHATIAILLRRNNHVARTIDLLRRRGLRASGEGGNPLTDSNAVLHVLSAMQLADHPGDSAAAFHVATSPLADSLGAHGVDPLEKSARDALSLALRARLARGGFGEMLGELLPTVDELVDAGAYGAWDAKRFAQLVDLGYAFDRREELRPGAFLDFVRNTKVEDPSSTQVKVMTIHASKGLEFDAVILPELDLSMTLRDPNVLRHRPEPDGELAGVSVVRSHAVCALDPDGLGLIRAEEDERHVHEALSLFYVAMTRAAHRLDLIVQDRNPRTLSYAKVLRTSLAQTDSSATADEPGVLWRHPDSAAAWWPKPPAEVGAPPRPEPRRPRFRAPEAPRDLRKKSPSAEEGGHALDVADLLRPRSGGGFTRGSLIHRWMQEIEWLDGFALDDATLDEIGAALERDPAVRAEALEAFRAALARPEIRALLTRPSDGAWEVWRERGFAEIVAEAGEQVLWTGSFDRVVLERDGAGAVRGAMVVDYKTDRVEGEGIDERVAFYAPQIASYGRVLARMTGLAVGAVEGRIALLEAGVVRRVEV
jgi:ATP-dependent exoDNAse (exonuclease V) beta subunit